MAQAFKFYKIGEANAEIARLSAENERLTKLCSDLESNTPESVTNLQAQLATAETTIKDLNAKISTASTDATALATAKAEIADLKLKLEVKGKEVETLASQKAAVIVAQTGAPAAPTVPAAAAVPAKSGGLKAVEAAFAAQINPVKN